MLWLAHLSTFTLLMTCRKRCNKEREARAASELHPAAGHPPALAPALLPLSGTCLCENTTFLLKIHCLALLFFFFQFPFGMALGSPLRYPGACRAAPLHLAGEVELPVTRLPLSSCVPRLLHM